MKNVEKITKPRRSKAAMVAEAISVVKLPFVERFEVQDGNLFYPAVTFEEAEKTELMDALSYWTFIGLVVSLMIHFN